MNPLGVWYLVLKLVERSFETVPPFLPAPVPQKVLAHLPDKYRFRHRVVYGISGTGKTRLLEQIVMGDIVERLEGVSERGVIVFDVHGDLYRNIRCRLALLARQQPRYAQQIDELLVPIDPVNIFDPSQPPEWTVGIDLLTPQPSQLPSDRAAMLRDFFMAVNADRDEYVRLKRVLYYAFLTLIQHPALDIGDVSRLLRDRNFRNTIVYELDDALLEDYWLDEFPRDQREAQQTAASSLNRVDPLVANPRVARLFAGRSTVNLRQLLDQGAIVLVNAPIGILGRDTAHLLCGLLLADIQQAALSRIDIAENMRRPATIVADEYHAYATETITEIIKESRKFGLELILASQQVITEGKNEALQKEILKTIGTIICFRVGSMDAELVVDDLLAPPVDQVKDVRLRWQKPFGVDVQYKDPVYRPLAEIKELARRGITDLQDRQYWVKTRGQPGIGLFETVDVVDVADLPDAGHLDKALRRQDEAARLRYGAPRVPSDAPRPHRPDKLPPPPRPANPDLPFGEPIDA